ncbi:TolC family protein [Seohaeicola zhoushanensis]
MKKLRTGCLAAAALLVAGSASSETLQQAVRTALTSNPEIRATTAEARASAYDLLKLQSEYQPIVTLYGKAQTQRVYDPGSQVSTDLGDTKFARQLGIEAELVVLDGNRRANLVYSNAARVDGNIFRLLDASETMALNVVEVYIDLYRHLRLQEAAARNLRRHREIGQKVNELVDGGGCRSATACRSTTGSGRLRSPLSTFGARGVTRKRVTSVSSEKALGPGVAAGGQGAGQLAGSAGAVGGGRELSGADRGDRGRTRQV